jgi:hypothetical protein
MWDWDILQPSNDDSKHARTGAAGARGAGKFLFGKGNSRSLLKKIEELASGHF